MNEYKPEEFDYRLYLINIKEIDIFNLFIENELLFKWEKFLRVF
jgi:hypothetical protein